MPVLDTNIDDGLSDARSLAASMRGGGGEVEELKNGAKENKFGSVPSMMEYRGWSWLKFVGYLQERIVVDDCLVVLIGQGQPCLDGRQQSLRQLDCIAQGNVSTFLDSLSSKIPKNIPSSVLIGVGVAKSFIRDFSS